VPRALAAATSIAPPSQRGWAALEIAA